MVERAEADDKIIAVLLGDPTYGELADITQLPRAVIDRLRHYFLTYKAIPGEAVNRQHRSFGRELEESAERTARGENR